MSGFHCQTVAVTVNQGRERPAVTTSTDPRQMYARALAQTETIIEKIQADQLGDPTPCTEYDVRSLLSHMVGGLNRAATMGEGGDGLAVPAKVDGVPDDGWPDAF